MHEEQGVNMSLLETNIKEMQKRCEDPLLLLSLVSIIVIIALGELQKTDHDRNDSDFCRWMNSCSSKPVFKATDGGCRK